VRKLLVLLCVLSLALLVTACAEEVQQPESVPTSDSSQTADSQEEETPADPTASVEQTTIRFSLWNAAMDENADFIVAFHEANPDIKIEMITIPEDYSAVVNTMVIGGTAADVILTWEVDMPRFAHMGAILPLDDFVANSDLGDLDDFIPAVANIIEMTDGLYGLPWVYAGHFLFYNKDMFDASDVAYPTADWTWDDLLEAAQALTIREGANVTQWGISPIDAPHIWFSLAGQAGDSVVDGDLNLALGNGLRRALQFQYDLTNVYEVSPQPEVGVVLDLFTAEMAAMTRAGNWFIRGYRDVPFNWDIAPLPRDVRTHTGLHTGFFTINNQTAHPEEAWRFIEFMMSYEGQTLLSGWTANPSSIMSIAEEGAFKVQGEHGPSNWEAFDYLRDYGAFTSTLLNPTVTGDLVGQFNSVILGLTSIDDVINTAVPNAQALLEQLQ